MRSWLKHPCRVAGRLVWLGFELILGGLRYLGPCAFRPVESTRRERAQWLRNTARRLLPIFRAQIHIDGPLPHRGLLVLNHLGYLDIVVLSACLPSVFVAKSDVQRWPVFGWYARKAGTIFAIRESRAQVGQLAGEITEVLDRGMLLILFPEGTSTGGDVVLPFKSSLLEPAVKTPHPLWAGSIAYALTDGDPAEEVCYWKDMTLVPHLLNLLGKKSVRVTLHFAPVTARPADRKELARQLRAQVCQLKGMQSAALRSDAPIP